jgi:hypothetical protein
MGAEVDNFKAKICYYFFFANFPYVLPIGVGYERPARGLYTSVQYLISVVIKLN